MKTLSAIGFVAALFGVVFVVNYGAALAGHPVSLWAMRGIGALP